MAALTQDPRTGGILTGERASQPLHQSLSSVFGFDSWYDTNCCPRSPTAGRVASFSASIRGDTHQPGTSKVLQSPNYVPRRRAMTSRTGIGPLRTSVCFRRFSRSTPFLRRGTMRCVVQCLMSLKASRINISCIILYKGLYLDRDYLSCVSVTQVSCLFQGKAFFFLLLPRTTEQHF